MYAHTKTENATRKTRALHPKKRTSNSEQVVVVACQEFQTTVPLSTKPITLHAEDAKRTCPDRKRASLPELHPFSRRDPEGFSWGRVCWWPTPSDILRRLLATAGAVAAAVAAPAAVVTHFLAIPAASVVDGNIRVD